MTVGAELERDRLLQRERQLVLVLRELRARARASNGNGRVPPGLGRAIADFEGELRDVRDRVPK